MGQTASTVGVESATPLRAECSKQSGLSTKARWQGGIPIGHAPSGTAASVILTFSDSPWAVGSSRYAGSASVRNPSERVVTISAKPKVERMGVSALEHMVSSWGWAYRSQEIEDYGIDGHIEPFDETDRPSGHLIAVQVKAGSSYFEKVDGGWCFRADQVSSKKKPKKEDKHLQYWLGHVLPVIVVMYDPATKTLYWQLITEELVEFTDRGWKILIPEDQVLDDIALGRLRDIAYSAGSTKNDPLTVSLPLLPPSAAITLEDACTNAPAGAMRLARILAEGRFQPELTAKTALVAQSSWLSTGQGKFEAAIGAFANDHGLPELAERAFTLAGEYGGPAAARIFAIAASLALARSDVPAAEGLLSRADTAGGGDIFLEVAQAALADVKSAEAFPAWARSAAPLLRTLYPFRVAPLGWYDVLGPLLDGNPYRDCFASAGILDRSAVLGALADLLADGAVRRELRQRQADYRDRLAALPEIGTALRAAVPR